MGICILPNKKKKNKEIDTPPASSEIIKCNSKIKEESEKKIIKKSSHNLDNNSIKSFFKDYTSEKNDDIEISQDLKNDSPKLETNKKPLNKNMKNSISILENTNIESKAKVISRNNSQKKNKVNESEKANNIESKTKVISRNSSQEKNKLNESKKEDCKIEEMNKNSQNNLENDFKKKYHCSYTYEQIIINLAHFIEINENDIQESFFSINTEDAIFELLKKNEKQILVNFLNSKKIFS